MKTVDAVLKDWVKPFSGEESEHWMEHINTLERKFAVKHKWIPRQFYFAIEGTLTGKAAKSLERLDQGLDVPNFGDFIPDWYAPDQAEWRLMQASVVFNQFSFRTRVVLVIYLFQRQFLHKGHKVSEFL